MDQSIQCYMVRVSVTPDLLGRSCLETYFIAESDRAAIHDSFRHAVVMIESYSLKVLKLEIFDCHLGMMSSDGVSQGGIDRMLYDSDNLTDSITKTRPDFIG